MLGCTPPVKGFFLVIPIATLSVPDVQFDSTGADRLPHFGLANADPTSIIYYFPPNCQSFFLSHFSSCRRSSCRSRWYPRAIGFTCAFATGADRLLPACWAGCQPYFILYDFPRNVKKNFSSLIPLLSEAMIDVTGGLGAIGRTSLPSGADRDQPDILYHRGDRLNYFCHQQPSFNSFIFIF